LLIVSVKKYLTLVFTTVYLDTYWFMPKFCSRIFRSWNTGVFGLSLIILVSCFSETEKNVDHIKYVDLIREKASRMVDEGDFDGAVAFFDSAYRIIPNPGIGDKIRKYSFMGQNYYPKLEDYKSAIANLDSIFLILNTKSLKNEYKRDYSTALFQKGDYLFKLNKYNEAYRYYYSGKLLAETILDPCSLSEYAYRLGMVSYKQEKYKEAASNFKQCFEEVGHCNNDFRIFAFQQELLANTALSYSKIGMVDSSIIFSNKALAFIKKNENRFPDRHKYTEMAKGVIYGNQAAVYLEKGDTAFAEKLLRRSFEINRRKGFDNNDAQLTLLKLGKLYVQTNQLDSALKTAVMLKLSLDSNYVLNVDIGLNEMNWKYYDKVGQTALAYTHLQNYLRLKDSLDSGNKKLVIADVDKEFRNIEQQYKYNLLSKDNEYKKKYLFIAVLFSIMAVVILFLLWKNWNASKKNILTLTFLNKQVTFQNGQLEQTLADLKESSNDKDRILKVVAHDLRNPIGAIANISSILLDEIKFSSDHQKMVEMVKDSSWQSIEMINELLNASIANRPSEMKLEWVDISDLIYKCVDQVRFKAEKKGQKIDLHLEEGIKIKADREKLARVLSNLIINAIKFSPINTAISVKSRLDAGFLKLSVEDAGIGIPAELWDHVFDMFGTSKRFGTLGEQPFGIGLPFSKQIVEAHHGKIWFESEVNKGTIFHVSVPVTEYTPTTQDSSQISV